MTLHNRFKESSYIIPGMMYSKPDFRNSIPHVSENFAIANSVLENTDFKEIADLPLLDTKLDQLNININSSSHGAYRLQDDDSHVLIAYRINPGEFKYVIFHNSGLLQNSKLSDNLQGYYLMIFKVSGDGFHFEPEGFSYLIQSPVEGIVDVLPLLTLEPTIPDYVSFHWAFLAMRHFNKTISNTIEYKYLATDPAEIELLKKVELYD